MFLRGVEGSSFAPFDRRCPVITHHTPDDFSSPEEYSFSSSDAIKPNHDNTVSDSLLAIKTGLTDLRSIEAQWLLYNACLISEKLQLSIYTDSPITKTLLEASITSKKAWQHWERF